MEYAPGHRTATGTASPAGQQLGVITCRTAKREYADLVDHEGLGPALSQRTTGLESLMLTAAWYLLPTEMRRMARAGVPTIWAWPTASWINHPDRHTELTVAAAMTQAVIELYDRPAGVGPCVHPHSDRRRGESAVM